jgi:hypothetical protein
VDLGVALLADAEAAEVVHVREAAFDDSAPAAEPGAVHGVAAGDARLDAGPPEQPAVLVVAIAAVGDDEVGLLARPSALAWRSAMGGTPGSR